MPLHDALHNFFTAPIDTRGTPYRHCRGCDDAGVVPKQKERPHTCRLCQRCLANDHDHTTCTNPVKP